MSLLCVPCNKTFATKASLERHEQSDIHAKKCACLEKQPKITEFFLLEAKIAAQDQVILQLSEKVAILETTTAALQASNVVLQATTATLTEQVTALVQANVQLAHAAEIAQLKLEHALELARRQVPVAPAPVAPQAPAPAQVRHTGVENDQLLIEKWFNHPRKYAETRDKDGDAKTCGIRDLAVKLQNKYKEKPDLPLGNNAQRLLAIYKDEVASKTDNPVGIQTAYMALLHPVFKWSPEDKAYLAQSVDFETNANQCERYGMTLKEWKQIPGPVAAPVEPPAQPEQDEPEQDDETDEPDETDDAEPDDVEPDEVEQDEPAREVSVQDRTADRKKRQEEMIEEELKERIAEFREVHAAGLARCVEHIRRTFQPKKVEAAIKKEEAEREKELKSFLKEARKNADLDIKCIYETSGY